MNKIKLNNAEFQLESYSRNTYFGGETVNSTATCSIKVDNINTLNALADIAITSIQIIHDGNVIYDLDCNAKIDNISEYFSMDTMNINLNLSFVNE